MVFGEPFVVADGAAELGDPGEGALDHPAARQYLEGVQVIGAADDLDGEPQRGGCPADQLPGVAAVGPDQADAAAGPVQVPEQRPGRVTVLDAAAVTTIVMIRPSVLTAMCRLRPLTFLAWSQPRVARARCRRRGPTGSR